MWRRAAGGEGRCPTDWRKVTLMDQTDRPQIDRPSANLAHNLAALRHGRGLTQQAVAKAAGVPRSTIANLESGEGNPSLAVLSKVARALGSPIDELLSSPRAKVRRWPAAEIATQRKGQNVTIRPLVPEPVPEEMMDLMDFAPAATLRGTPHLPGTREYFTCLEGRVRIIVAGERHDLDAGDVLAFPGGVAHAYQNLDDGREARGVSIVVLAKAGA
jgi:transcriptional regulator with XRE-family HTH domain